MDAKQLQKQERRLYSKVPLIGGLLRRRAAGTLARDRSAKAIKVLAQAITRSDDERVRAIALAALRGGESQACIDAACAVWVDTRHPDLAALLGEQEWVASKPVSVRVFSALQVGRLEIVTAGKVQVVGPLVQACEDADPTIAQRAQYATGKLDNPRARQALADQLCGQWAKTRSPQLEELMLQRRYVAQEPLEVRVLSALKTVQPQFIIGLGAGVVDPLLRACEDSDTTIAGGARLLLPQLKHKAAREAVCRLVIEQDHPLARAAALDGKYMPRDVYQRALFFFLTEQWERYEDLDFDQRMLRTAYEAADEALRQRIRERLRAAGRADFLTVVAGGDYRSRATVMTSSEAEFLVKMLAAQKEWSRLWNLAFELSFGWSVRILQILAQNDWRPPARDEMATFETLAALVADEVLDSEDVTRSLPPAVQRARARVPGRINAVAFSPLRPLIAVGTGQRKVVLWNLKRARREQVLDTFQHSIGHATFAQDGALWCAERTNSTRAACVLYRWGDGEMLRVGQHIGSVTAIEPIGDAQILTTGRDYKAIVWSRERRVEERRFGSWARAAAVSPDGTRAALLHEGVTLVSLPQLNFVAGGSGGRGVSRCAAFSPNGSQGERALIVGKFNGAVVVNQRKGRNLRLERQPLVQHRGQVQGIEVLAGRSVVITAGSQGRVQFTAWANRTPIGEIQVRGQRLTSLRVSPDGVFMAIGDSDASMSLWDLRVLDVPLLFAGPFAQAQPVHLPGVTALAHDASLSPRVRNAVRFVECVLRHRFRYDIEVDELPEIQAGEFDIELEG